MKRRSFLAASLAATTMGSLNPALAADKEAFDPTSLEALRAGMPDPAAIEARDGSGYYVYATGHGVVVWHSKDLQTWKRIGRVFDRHVPAWSEKAIPGCDGIWAPDIQYMDGTYYLYYSVSTFGSQRSVIGLATNRSLNPEDPKYRWQDRGLVLESLPEKHDYNAIDPAMFVDDDGKAYLYWGSYWTGIKGVEINRRTGKPASSQPPNTGLARRSPRGDTPDIEAPYVIKRQGYYYLMASWDFCCAGTDSSYKIVVGRSKNPLGPFTDQDKRPMLDGGGSVMLASDVRWRGPGHNSFLQTAKGDFLVHHTYDANQVRKGRILQIRPVTWEKNGWPQVGNPLSDAEATTRNKKSLSPLVGKWKHVVNDRDRYDIYFEVSGSISGTAGKSFWKRQDRKLQLRWLDPNAPNGAWVDEVQLNAEGTAYYGKNQTGTVIRGTKVRD
jgi:arabinan endo-1,5-alpha-L-arabinosidase